MSRKAEILEGLRAATPALRRYARALCAGAGLVAADDLVQETLQSIGSRIRKKEFRPADHAEARIEAYIALTALASRKLVHADRPGSRHPPIMVGLANLCFEDRVALLLVSLEGFGYEAAARIVGVSRENFLARLARARAEFNAETSSTDSRHRRSSHLRVVK